MLCHTRLHSVYARNRTISHRSWLTRRSTPARSVATRDSHRDHGEDRRQVQENHDQSLPEPKLKTNRPTLIVRPSFLEDRRIGLANVDSQVEDPETDDAPIVRSPAQQLRQKQHLDRLDKLIDPHSLDATLDAHRRWNRELPNKSISSRRHEQVANVPDDSSPADSPEALLAKILDPRSKLNSLSRRILEKRSNEGTLTAQAILNGENGHLAEEDRRTLLRKYEEPLQPLSEEMSREAYFDSLRRVRQILMKSFSNDVFHSKDTTPSTPLARDIKAGLYSLPGDIMLYAGRPVHFKKKPHIPLLTEPWTAPIGSSNAGRNKLKLLDAEIEAFAAWMEPTAGEKNARTFVTDQILKIVHSATDGEIGQELVGSSVTGLHLPISDIDIRLYLKDNGKNADRPTKLLKTRQYLTKIESALKSSLTFKDTHYRDANFYFLIDTTHTETNQKIQLNLGPSGNRSLAKQLEYLETYPYLKPTYLVLRSALNMRDLDEVFTGGLGSYTLLCMIVAYFRQANPLDDPTANDWHVHPYANRLMGFLDFWSNFDTVAEGISIEPPEIFPKIQQTQGLRQRQIHWIGKPRNGQHLSGLTRMRQPVRFQPYLLCLQDPSDEFNDLGRASFAIKDITSTFNSIKRNLDRNTEGRKYRLSGNKLRYSVLWSAVGRCDLVWDEHRARMELFGEKKAAAVASMRDGEIAEWWIGVHGNVHPAAKNAEDAQKEAMEHARKSALVYDAIGKSSSPPSIEWGGAEDDGEASELSSAADGNVNEMVGGRDEYFDFFAIDDTSSANQDQNQDQDGDQTAESTATKDTEPETAAPQESDALPATEMDAPLGTEADAQTVTEKSQSRTETPPTTIETDAQTMTETPQPATETNVQPATEISQPDEHPVVPTTDTTALDTNPTVSLGNPHAHGEGSASTPEPDVATQPSSSQDPIAEDSTGSGPVDADVSTIAKDAGDESGVDGKEEDGKEEDGKHEYGKQEDGKPEEEKKKGGLFSGLPWKW